MSVVAPADLAVEFWLGSILPEAMPSIATNMLMEGYDSPALREVAGLSARDDPRDIRDSFQQALAELNVWLPDRLAAQRHATAVIAGDLSSGQLTASQTENRICRVWTFDEWLYDQVPADLEDFVSLCWLRGSDHYAERGGDERLIAIAATIAARTVELG
jgi:hypothetical protein